MRKYDKCLYKANLLIYCSRLISWLISGPQGHGLLCLNTSNAFQIIPVYSSGYRSLKSIGIICWKMKNALPSRSWSGPLELNMGLVCWWTGWPCQAANIWNIHKGRFKRSPCHSWKPFGPNLNGRRWMHHKGPEQEVWLRYQNAKWTC